MEIPFAEILEAADKLSLDDQEELIGALRPRVTDRKREELAREIQEARREFLAGRGEPKTPADLLKDTLS
jgi:hypothetical protein